MKNFDYCVFVGNFSPVKLEDEVVLKEALQQAEKAIVVVGSHKQARNIRVPWTSEERIEMFKSVLSSEDVDRVHFIVVKDQLYNETLWIADLLGKVSEITGKSDNIALICREKDKADYLRSFPQWNQILVKTDFQNFRPEEIRYRYFTYDTSYQRQLNPNVVKRLEAFKDSEFFKNLKSDFDYIRDYHQSWEGCPFKPIFVTVDAVVACSAHILCVRRKGNPGKGLIALPGGFLNQEEQIEDAAIRELREETVIKMSKEELRKHITDNHVFSAPYRSLRGRTITHAYLMDLGNGPLPQVKGSSDADKAFWLPLNEIKDREEDFFEDHWHIINFFANKI